MKEGYLATFLFHHLGQPNHSGDIYSLPVKRFRTFLEVAQSHTDDFIRLDQLKHDGLKGSRNYIALCFDDGYQSDYTRALPLLKDYDLPATFFVVPAWVGKDGYLTWSQVRKLSDARMAIGSHTRTHPWLPELSSEELRAELRDSKSEIEAQIDKPVELLAIPGGYCSRIVVTEAFAAGYGLICTSRYGLDRPSKGMKVIKRNSIDQRSSWSMIHSLLAGKMPLGLLLSSRMKRFVANLLGPSIYKRLSDKWRQR